MASTQKSSQHIVNMASPSPDIKQEPSGEDHDMGTVSPFQPGPVDADLPEQNGGNQGQHNDNSPTEQNGGNQGQQNDNNPTEQNGGNQGQQNHNSPTEQNGGNQAQQNHNNPARQNNNSGSEQASGNNDRNNKQKSQVTNQDIRALIQDRLGKKKSAAKTPNGISKPGGHSRTAERREHRIPERQENSNSSPPLQQDTRTSETSLSQQSLQKPSPSSPSTSDNDVHTDNESDSDIAELTGFQTPAANMKTKGVLKTGDKPRYLNEYSAGNRIKYRIQSIKSRDFNPEGAPLISNPKWRAAQEPASWSEIGEIGGEIIGVAAAGNERDHSTFLARLDPMNEDRFQYRQTIYLIIRLPDNKLAVVDRGWIRRKFDPSDESQKLLFKEKHPDGCWYRYKTKDDPTPRWRENRNAFQDTLIFNIAYRLEKKYHKVRYAGENFIIDKREARSPTPYEDEILRFRESTIPADDEIPSLGVVQSVESSFTNSVPSTSKNSSANTPT